MLGRIAIGDLGRLVEVDGERSGGPRRASCGDDSRGKRCCAAFERARPAADRGRATVVDQQHLRRGSCSAWLSRSAATTPGSALSSAMTISSLGPAGMSIAGPPGKRGDIASWPRRPRHCRGRRSCRPAGSSPAPNARAAIACAPPTVQIASIPHISAASAITGSSPPSGRGGVTTTISRTPATRAGSASISSVEKSGVFAARNVEADPVDRPPDLAHRPGPASSRPDARRAGSRRGRRRCCGRRARSPSTSPAANDRAGPRRATAPPRRASGASPSSR